MRINEAGQPFMPSLSEFRAFAKAKGYAGTANHYTKAFSRGMLELERLPSGTVEFRRVVEGRVEAAAIIHH